MFRIGERIIADDRWSAEKAGCSFIAYRNN
jgi:hypothetical protein